MNETKPKKMVSRNVAIALGIICIILVACIATIWVYYLVQDINKNQTITNLNNQVFNDESEITNLQDQNKQLQVWLNANETVLNRTQTWLAGNESLLSLTETWLNGNVTYITFPNLGLTDLTVVDNRTNPQMPYLYINGVVNNFGIDNSTASQSSQLPYFGYIQVRAYHDDGSLALNTGNQIGNIVGQSSMNVTMNLNYNGTPTTSWTMNVSIVYILG